MMKRATAILILIISLLFLTSASMSVEIYQWKDKDGKTYFSDTPPPGVNTETRQFKDSPSPGPGKRSEGLKSPGPREKRPYGRIEVTMYVTSWCPQCKKARECLRSLGVNFTEYDIEKDKAKYKEMLLKSGGRTGVPVIDVEGIILRGFSESQIKTAVEKKRELR